MKRTITLATALMLLLSACSDDNNGMGGEFVGILSSNPDNLDPQLAEDKSSWMVIKNVFSTLMELDESGNVVQGAAESYTVSADGKVYTFTLREGLVWKKYNSTVTYPLTAQDYVYAFRRIYNKNTHSPYTEKFSIIKNSMEYYNSPSAAGIGIYADDDRTVRIELEYPSCDFIRLLAHPASAPCNEDLFLSTQGRYGLSKDDIYCCGPFYITEWNFDPYWDENRIQLARISQNTLDGFETYPDSVRLEITSDRVAFEKKNSIQTDVYTSDRYADYTREVSKDYNISEYVSRATYLVVSEKSPICSDDGARKAFMAAVDMEQINKALSEDSVPAVGVFPDGLVTCNTPIRSILSKVRGVTRASGYKVIWDSFVKNNPGTDFNSYNLLVNDAYPSENVAFTIVDNLEKSLELYCMAEFCNERDFDEKIRNEEFDAALITVDPSYNSVDLYSDLIGSLSGSLLSYSALQIDECDELSERKLIVSDFDDANAVKAYYLPISFEKEYLISKNNISGVVYDPFTDVINFKSARMY